MPINSEWFKVVKPDGSVAKFARDPQERNGLMGDGEWIGEIQGRSTLFMKGQAEGLRFVDGHLVETLEHGQVRKHAAPEPQSDAEAFQGLWKPDADAVRMREIPDIWQGGDRLKLWFKNPNHAAIIFVQLSVLFLCLVLCRGKVMRVIGGIGLVVALYFLVRTGSRGGLVALGAGGLSVALTRVRQLLNWKVLACIVAVGIAVAGFAAATGVSDRYSRNFLSQDGNDSRLVVWKEVPRMMADAPCGWGIGESGRAYVDWYQKKCTSLFDNMISSHLTCLVEFGIVGRFLYVFGWIASVCLAFLFAIENGRSPFALATLISFGVGGVFNPVFQRIELWVLPVLAIGIVLCSLRTHAHLRVLAVAACLAAVILGGATYVGKQEGRDGNPQISFHGGRVSVGAGNPTTWIVDDDYTLHGGYWWLPGREIRDYCATHSDIALGYVRRLDCLPDRCETLVLIGKAGKAFLECWKRNGKCPEFDRLILVSPAVSASEMPDGLVREKDMLMLQGEFAARLTDVGVSKPDWLRVVRGAELYVPHWLNAIFHTKQTTKGKERQT